MLIKHPHEPPAEWPSTHTHTHTDDFRVHGINTVFGVCVSGCDGVRESCVNAMRICVASSVVSSVSTPTPALHVHSEAHTHTTRTHAHTHTLRMCPRGVRVVVWRTLCGGFRADVAARTISNCVSRESRWRLELCGLAGNAMGLRSEETVCLVFVGLSNCLLLRPTQTIISTLAYTIV